MTDTRDSSTGLCSDVGEEGLDARLVVERGTFRLDVALTAAPGEVVALLGPNGAARPPPCAPSPD